MSGHGYKRESSRKRKYERAAVRKRRSKSESPGRRGRTQSSSDTSDERRSSSDEDRYLRRPRANTYGAPSRSGEFGRDPFSKSGGSSRSGSSIFAKTPRRDRGSSEDESHQRDRSKTFSSYRDSRGHPTKSTSSRHNSPYRHSKSSAGSSARSSPGPQSLIQAKLLQWRTAGTYSSAASKQEQSQAKAAPSSSDSDREYKAELSSSPQMSGPEGFADPDTASPVAQAAAQRANDIATRHGTYHVPPAITNYLRSYRPDGSWDSKQIAGSNQDCVLAAFRSVKRGIAEGESRFASKMTSRSEDIASLAQAYHMESVDRETLPSFLPALMDRQGPPAGATRAFISTRAASGPGRHAYAAIGVDTKTGKIVAWDPDDNEKNLKLVPMSFIIKAYAPYKR
ncbi:MAG: hypothetical protein ACTHNZ_15815 [Trinickia sp.]|uniref:hypothetical protein n=1 Tax=Trinickia sp. TaxID=2571163 RepID=UPI003F81BA02